MKRSILFYIGLILINLTINKVYAASFSANLVGNDTFTDDNNQISIELKVSNYQDLGETCGGICGLSADFSYDEDKIELVSISALNSFRLTQGPGTIVLSNSVGVASGSSILTMTFKNIGLNDGESTTITISGISGTEGDNEMEIGSISKSLKYTVPAKPSSSEEPKPSSSESPKPSSSESPKPSSSTNNNTNESKASSSSSEKEKSNNADLKALTISNGELTFAKNVLIYNVVVSDSVTSITIKATPEDDKAKITGTGTFKLKSEENEFEIKVIAEDGTEKAYKITVNKDKTISPTETSEVITTGTNSKPNTSPKLYIIPLIICLIVLLVFVCYKYFKKYK